MAIVGVTKMRILRELHRGPLNIYQVSDKLRLPYGTTSYHLKEFRENDFVSARRNGNQSVQSLTDRGRQLLKLIDG